MSPKGGGQAREREGGPSTVSKSFDLQEAPPPPPHESKRGQKRSPSGSSVSDDSVSPPPVKVNNRCTLANKHMHKVCVCVCVCLDLCVDCINKALCGQCDEVIYS